MNGNSQAHGAYVPPQVIEIGSLVELTAQGNGGTRKPCTSDDGLSGTVGNCSGADGGTIGS
jgi:hypothetical protein